jgi:hypothetical protein
MPVHKDLHPPPQWRPAYACIIILQFGYSVNQSWSNRHLREDRCLKEIGALILFMLKNQCFILRADFDFITRFEFARQ